MIRNLYEAVARPKPPAIQASEVDRPSSPDISQSYFQLFKKNVIGFISSGSQAGKEAAADQPRADPGAIIAFREQRKVESEKEQMGNVVVAAAVATKAVHTKSIKVGPDHPASVKETKSCATETKPSSADENEPPSKVVTPKTAKKTKGASAESGKIEPSSGDEKESPSKIVTSPIKLQAVKKTKSVESKPLAVLFSDENSESESDSYSSYSSSEEHQVPAKPSNLKKPTQNSHKRRGPKKKVRFRRKIKEVREFYS